MGLIVQPHRLRLEVLFVFLEVGPTTTIKNQITRCSYCSQAAKEAYGADEAAKAKQAVLDHMSKRKGTDDKEDVKYTPLCIAAFRSNWALFRRIYDEFERRDGGRWPRDLVSGRCRGCVYN